MATSISVRRQILSPAVHAVRRAGTATSLAHLRSVLPKEIMQGQRKKKVYV